MTLIHEMKHDDKSFSLRSNGEWHGSEKLKAVVDQLRANVKESGDTAMDCSHTGWGDAGGRCTFSGWSS